MPRTRSSPLILVALAAVLVLPWPGRADDAEGFKPLFNGKGLAGLKVQLPKNADPAGVFTVENGVLVVSGKPNGYVYTDKAYRNYVLRFDWQYPDKAGNSGTLVHIQEPHKVWPRCVEVQGQQQNHGHTFAIGGARGEYKTDKEAQKKAIRGVGQWNSTEIISQDGELTTKVNGVQVATGKGNLTEGPIGWQSEGTRVLFRNLRIKELK